MVPITWFELELAGTPSLVFTAPAKEAFRGSRRSETFVSQCRAHPGKAKAAAQVSRLCHRVPRPVTAEPDRPCGVWRGATTAVHHNEVLVGYFFPHLLGRWEGVVPSQVIVEISLQWIFPSISLQWIFPSISLQ